MRNITLDNYGSGWEWHGTTKRGKAEVRHAFETARDKAIHLYGERRVSVAETIAGIRDRYVLAYTAEQLGVSELFGVGLPTTWDLLHTPDIDSRRYADYCEAAKTLGVRAFANLPYNYTLVVRAAGGDSRSLDTLNRVGQWGLGVERDATCPDYGPYDQIDAPSMAHA